MSFLTLYKEFVVTDFRYGERQHYKYSSRVLSDGVASLHLQATTNFTRNITGIQRIFNHKILKQSTHHFTHVCHGTERDRDFSLSGGAPEIYEKG